MVKLGRTSIRWFAIPLCSQTLLISGRVHSFSIQTRRNMSNRDELQAISKSGVDAAQKIAITDTNNQTPATTANATTTTKYFLLKSEPNEFSIQQLKEEMREEWDGVRNYAARNHLRSMRVGDLCWFYHSSCATPAIVGTCRIVREAIPDVTAFQDPKHENYDPKSTAEKCRWDSVLVEFDSIYETPITLKELRNQGKHDTTIANMVLLNRNRLSVMPVTASEWSAVHSLIERKTKGETLLD